MFLHSNTHINNDNLLDLSPKIVAKFRVKKRGNQFFKFWVGEKKGGGQNFPKIIGGTKVLHTMHFLWAAKLLPINWYQNYAQALEIKDFIFLLKYAYFLFSFRGSEVFTHFLDKVSCNCFTILPFWQLSAIFLLQICCNIFKILCSKLCPVSNFRPSLFHITK